MTAPHAEQIVADYMARLESALAPVPDARRQELLDEVRAHIADARRELPDETDADLLNILDRLGDPAETAAAELGRIESPAQNRRNSRLLEIAAIVLVPLFWPVGVILLWMSEAWSTRDKLIGTLVPPGGFLGTIFFGLLVTWGTIAPVCRTVTDETGRVLSSTCPSSGAQTVINSGAVLLGTVYLVGPILTAAYLAYRLQRAGRGRDQAEHPEVFAGAA
jgi:uncharacterized membrane protein